MITVFGQSGGRQALTRRPVPIFSGRIVLTVEVLPAGVGAVALSPTRTGKPRRAGSDPAFH